MKPAVDSMEMVSATFYLSLNGIGNTFSQLSPLRQKRVHSTAETTTEPPGEQENTKARHRA